MLKTDGLGALLEVEMLKKCTALWREAHLEGNILKNWGCRSTFGSWDVEKVHGVVARSTFGSQKCEKLRGFGAILEVEMLKKCTALWREAHLEVKNVKTWGVRSTFGNWDVEKVHGVVARSTFGSQNVLKTEGVGAVLEVEMLKKCTALWREAHLEVKMC